MSAALWLLPDDGIVDPVAVELTAAGARRVRLTARERGAAAALILSRGGTVKDIAARLYVSEQTARLLACTVRAAAALAGAA
ncbi:MAG: hypothetical protein ACRDNZ_08090 [Streptosporangiaceae bacterium]